MLFCFSSMRCYSLSFPGVPAGISRPVCAEGAICGCLGQVEQSQWSSQRLIGACCVDIAYCTRYTRLTHHGRVNNKQVLRSVGDDMTVQHKYTHVHTTVIIIIQITLKHTHTVRKESSLWWICWCDYKTFPIACQDRCVVKQMSACRYLQLINWLTCAHLKQN